VAKIKYGLIPELENKIKNSQEELAKIQKKGQRILKEEVGEEDIAKVNPVHVIVAGLIAAVLFVLGLVVLVKWVVASGAAA
jgi:hypothetical protein